MRYIRDRLSVNYATNRDERPQLAFQFAQHLLEDGYDYAYLLEFYDIFQALALPHAPYKHWEMIDARMRRFLGITDIRNYSHKSHHQIGYERAYPVIEHQRPMKDITPQRPRLAYAR